MHAVLDAAALCHVSYVVDGYPYCTPTLFWREVCPRLMPGVGRPAHLGGYCAGRTLEEALTEAHRRAYADASSDASPPVAR